MPNRNYDPILIDALLSGASTEVAARIANISERTVYRRERDPDFIRQKAIAWDSIIENISGKFLGGLNSASDVMFELLQESPPNIRRLVAKDIFELALKLRNQSTVERRLIDIESILSRKIPNDKSEQS